jgi:hypothetical protein
VAEHHSKKSDSLIPLPDLEKLEEEIKSQFYELRNGKIWFSGEIKREHRRLVTSRIRYVLHSRFFVLLTAPFIYVCFIPLAPDDLFVSTYQAVCFLAYGIPKARRKDYMAMDRGKWGYWNVLEALNCTYCSYANGLWA